MADFGSTNQEIASFIVSVYVVGYCFGPLLIAPLSELYGRAPLYHVCNVLFVIFSVACALAPNLGGLVAFRLLAGLAGSCPMAIGPGTIADLVPREKRGKVMAAWVFGPLFGPVIGPIGMRSSMPCKGIMRIEMRANGGNISWWVSHGGQGLALVILGSGHCGESRTIRGISRVCNSNEAMK